MRSSGWKDKWLRQRKKDKSNPALRTYKYQCGFGHIRIEKDKLTENPLPICPACESSGKNSRFSYVGLYTMTRTDSKKSKF